MLFAGHDYYAGGGMEDYVGDYDDFSECQNALGTEVLRSDWAHVFDTTTGEVTHLEPPQEDSAGGRRMEK